MTLNIYVFLFLSSRLLKTNDSLLLFEHEISMSFSGKYCMRLIQSEWTWESTMNDTNAACCDKSCREKIITWRYITCKNSYNRRPNRKKHNEIINEITKISRTINQNQHESKGISQILCTHAVSDITFELFSINSNFYLLFVN